MADHEPDSTANLHQMATQKGVYQQTQPAPEVQPDHRVPVAPVRSSRSRVVSGVQSRSVSGVQLPQVATGETPRAAAQSAPGILPLPQGSRGPRSLYLRREDASFGFTLRHFIVYPPDSVTAQDGRHAAVGALRDPMETIFVKQVYEGGPAHKAGLHHGDRLVSVNNVSLAGKSYQQVVQLIQQSPPYMHLCVVPKEDDVLQKFFPETAHNPETNSRPKRFASPDTYSSPRRQSSVSTELRYRPITAPHSQPSLTRPADSISWRSYEEPIYSRSSDGILLADSDNRFNRFSEVNRRIYSSARTPGYRDSASYKKESIYSDPKDSLTYRPIRLPATRHSDSLYAEPYAHDYTGRPRAQPQTPCVRAMGRRASEGSEHSYDYSCGDYLGSPNPDMVVNGTKVQSGKPADPELGLPACRLVMDARRESNASLNSSLADGSKDSLSSYDSASTLTGQDTDESIIMRFRKTIEKKEEFLKRPTQPILYQAPVIPREFYGRPQKLQKEWPPCEPGFLNGQESPKKPTHQNFQRVKIDIDSERDYLYQNGKEKTDFLIGGVVSNIQRNSQIRQSKDKNNFVTTLSRIHENNSNENTYQNGSNEAEIRYPPKLQIVHRRTQQFESGRPVPDEDDTLSDRTNFYRSELARISAKRVVPNVQVRKREFETLEIDNNRDFRRGRTQRESRSLDHSVLAERPATFSEVKLPISSNQFIPIGSSKVHCEPPEGYQATDVPIENDLDISIRARSNSAESWCAAMQNAGSAALGAKNRSSLAGLKQASLDSDSDRQRNRVVRQDSYLSALKSKVTVPGDVPQVVRRVKNNTNTNADEDRATRRVSYLKATWGDRMHIESDLDLSDNEISPHVLRSRSTSADGSGSLSSPERECAPVHREGALCCKFIELEGKRANDRSWHKVWAVLKGPHLYLYKDRHHHHHHHPSPVGLVSEHQLPEGFDMRYSTVEIAGNYTKRKNVLRISTVQSRNELLLQADGPVEMADWLRSLQEQNGAPTELDEKGENITENKQAVPQSTPANTSIQVPRLSPQTKTKSASRNRSPTGQSPKSKTWRGRVVKQFKKLNQSGSPNSPTTPDKLTFGVPLENCPKSETFEYVPKFVEMCTDIIEQRGLEVVGIYRVPGNSAAVSALTEELNKGINVTLQDAKCDTNVVSSLLKSFFRKLPDSLLTSELYPRFIDADKIENPKQRLHEIKSILADLQIYQYETLKHLILHLKKVVDNSEVNKMEARNLAIMFGPTLVRSVEDDMVTMVTDMSHQCRIVESLLLHAEWFFSEDDGDVEIAGDKDTQSLDNASAAVNNTLLLGNISKIEGIKDNNTNPKKVVSSIISAANRKIQRKPRKPAEQTSISKDEATTPTNETKDTGPLASNIGQDRTDGASQEENIKQTNPLDSEESSSDTQPVDSLLLTYPQRDAKHLERIEKFKQETMAMLQKKRRTTDLGWDREQVPPRDPASTHRDSWDRPPAATPAHWEHREDDTEESQSGSELMTQITSIFDDKMKALQSPINCLTVADNIPYADESPDVQLYDITQTKAPKNEQTTPNMSPKSFRDPSLHKSNSTSNFSAKLQVYEKSENKENQHNEKDIDTKNNYSAFLNKELKCSSSDSKLKRSESLNKSDKNYSDNGKLKRSVSLNRAADRLRRSDSLTKYEKTESNINLRRELEGSKRKKIPTKLKRKNGMPERSIKRRHTVGGTKDFDKLPWLDNKLRYEAEQAFREKEKSLRSSSPDLSSDKPLESHI